MSLDSISNDKIEKYLKKVEGYIYFHDTSVKYEIIHSIKEMVLKYHAEHGDDFDKTLTRFDDIYSLLNVELNKRALPLLERKKKSNFLKYILMAFITFLIIGTISIILLIKSFTPLVNVDDIDGTLELFGGRFVLEKDVDDFFTKINDTKFKQWKTSKNTQLLKGSFDFSSDAIKKNLLVDINEGELAVRTHPKTSIKYNCHSESNLKNVFSSTSKGFQMNLQEGRSYCLLYVPKKMNLTILMNRGNINIAEMDQDLDVFIKDGTLSWKQSDRSDYFIESIEGDLVKGDKSNFSTTGIYKAKIKVSNGEIRFRK